MGKSGPCGHCGVTTTPLWRNGPPDKPVLCNACGSRWRTRGNLTNYLPASLGGSGHGGGYYARGSKSAWCKSSKENCRKTNSSSSSLVVKVAQPKQLSASSTTTCWTGEHLQNRVSPWKGLDWRKGEAAATTENNGVLAKRPRLPTSCGRCDTDAADVSSKTPFTIPVTVASPLESTSCLRRSNDAVELADESEQFADHGAGSGSMSVSIPCKKRSLSSRLRAAPKKTYARISSLTNGFYEAPENHVMHEGVTLAMGVPNAAPQTVLVQGIGLCNVVDDPSANPLSVIVPMAHQVMTTIPNAGIGVGVGFPHRVESPAHVGGQGDILEGNESIQFAGLRGADAINLASFPASDSGGEQLAAGSGEDLAPEAADAMAGGKRTDSEGASAPSVAGESNGGGGETSEKTKKKVKKADIPKGWHLEKRSRTRKVALLDEYPYNKRDVLSSCYSPLAYLELKDIVNMEAYTKMLMTQEQEELMKLLPPDDAKNKGSLADMFNSCQFDSALVNFQHLLVEGMFDSSEMGPSARVFEHYQKLLSVVDLTSSGWTEGVTQLCKRSRRRGQPSDAGKDEIDDAWLASEMAAFAERRASSQKASEGSSRKAHPQSRAEVSPPEEDAANDRCLRGAESAVSSSNSREPSQRPSCTSGGPSQREGNVADGYVVAEPVIMGHQDAEPIEDQNAASAHLAPTVRSAPVVAMQSVAMGPQFWNTQQWQRADPVVGAQCIVSNVATGNCEPVSGKSGKRPHDGGTESTPVSIVTYPAGSGEGMSFVNSMYGARGWFKPPTVCDRLTTGLQAVPPTRGEGISGGIWAAGSPIVDSDRYVAIPVPSVSIASPVAVPVPVPDFIRVVETVDDGSAAPRSHSTKGERHPSYIRASCREECAVSCSTVASPLVNPIPGYPINGSTSPLDALLYNGVVRVVGSGERAEGSGIGGDYIRRPVTAGGTVKSYCSAAAAAAAATPAPCNGAEHGVMYTVQVDPRKISYAQALPVMHARDMLLVPNPAAYPAMLMTGEGWQMYTDPMWENVLWANQGCAGQDRRLLNGPVLYQSQIP